MPQNRWIVICPELKAPGLWSNWLREKCVAIGWGPPHFPLRGPTESPGWDIARTRASEVREGDIVIPYLLRFRLGTPGQVTNVAIEDSNWRPTAPDGFLGDPDPKPGLGRRIEVGWCGQDVPPLGKIALVPTQLRKGPVARQTIERLSDERYERLTAIISNPANWIDYEAAPGAAVESPEEDAIPTTESDPSKLVLREDLVRSLLARNLDRIETGLNPHPDFSRLEEVTFELGRLDILCRDAKDRSVILELQLGCLDDTHIGKTCRYFGWFKKKYGDAVRAILVFESADPDVMEAYKNALPWLELRQLNLNIEVSVQSCGAAS
jgi:hypothetical protein